MMDRGRMKKEFGALILKGQNETNAQLRNTERVKVAFKNVPNTNFTN